VIVTSTAFVPQQVLTPGRRSDFDQIRGVLLFAGLTVTLIGFVLLLLPE